ncbi:efflux transporter outer membrane subunit [Sphingobium cloacae]|uniref:RND transporter n=1 Tax=Sphingobium cloacae TaxID=120107 RepID=A0A1E1F1G7_9SPHN|nr:TolC family protein [Sphingobium cloacae]BAV64369.1 RND transporter [Sphingobium cloacae]
MPASITHPAAAGAEEPPDKWWSLYREPALDALVEEALANNRDLRAASARLLEARAVLSEAHAARLPETGLSVEAGRGSTLEDQIAASGAGSDHVRTGPRFGFGTDISWEVDLWGRIGATEKVAIANMREAAALQDGLRVAVAAETTRAWLDACGHARQADMARQSLAFAERGRDLAQSLRAAGAGSPADVLRAETLAAQASAAVPPVEAARRSALAELAVLTGHPPTEPPAAAIACVRLPSMAAIIPVGDGAALLRRRPDIRAAEQKLAGGTARIGIAVADLYPRISLGGGLAMSSPSIAGLDARRNRVWRFGPLLSWSFPNISIARARIRQARASEIAALAAFDAVILNALREVNQAAEVYSAALRRMDALRVAADRAGRARRLVWIQRSAGAATALDMLDADRTDMEAQAALASAEMEVATAQVVLFKALGGGWQSAPPVILPLPERPSSIASSAISSK